MDNNVLMFENTTKLSEDIASLYLSKKFSDLTLKVTDEKLPAHKVILGVRNEYFENLLYDDIENLLKTEISIPDVQPKVFKTLLKYIYAGDVTIKFPDDNLSVELLKLAFRFSFDDLASLIIEKLKTKLNLENVFFILNTSNSQDWYHLRKYCLNFMDRHASEVLAHKNFITLTKDSLIKLTEGDSFYAPEIEIFNGIMKWCRNKKNFDTSVIKSVRLSCLTVKQIVADVWPLKLVESETLLSAIAEIVEVRQRSLSCRARLLWDENIASPAYKATVIHGKNSNYLLTGNRDVDKCAEHAIGDKDGITIKLETLSIINHIQILFWDKSWRYYSYYIEVSENQKQWKKIIDYTKYACRSCQNLYFDQEIVRYIRVVGTSSNEKSAFQLVFLEADFRTTMPEIVEGIVRPLLNVASLDKNALVIKGENPKALLNGDFKNYDDNNGYTYHKIGSDQNIIVELAQPYVISVIKLLLWDLDDRYYKYFIETSANMKDWELIIDRRNENCKSWQILRFPEKPVVFIKITGTYSSKSGNDYFRCIHLECFTGNKKDEAEEIEIEEPPAN